MAQDKRELIEMAEAMEKVGKSTEANGKAIGEVLVKINVDVTEALTGLKAVQREAKKATQALRELEAVRDGE